MVSLHDRARVFIEKRGKRYAKRVNKDKEGRDFVEGNLVWFHPHMERFPHLMKSKLLPQGIRPFRILKKINDNTYILDMPQDYGMDNLNLKTNSLQEGESNTDQGGQDKPVKNVSQTLGESLQEPLTKGRLKKLKAEVKRNMELLRGQGVSKEGSY
ncbi:hypothetical protein CR513_04848, partial [Mucuna pruriens]